MAALETVFGYLVESDKKTLKYIYIYLEGNMITYENLSTFKNDEALFPLNNQSHNEIKTKHTQKLCNNRCENILF